jgi:retron-type reverse transcriptase
MSLESRIAAALADAFVAGPIQVQGLIHRASEVLGRRWHWLGPLAKRICSAYGGNQPRPRKAALIRFLMQDEMLALAVEEVDVQVKDWFVAPHSMAPVAAAAAWPVPAICTPGELADWLGINLRELAWFADRRGWEAKRAAGRLRHYRYQVRYKKSGQLRLIESPKPRLKILQRRILDEILNRVPVHDAAHGFRCGRSIVTFAAPHVHRRVVLKIDLANFFPSIRFARVEAIFRTVGYPHAVAQLLAGVCTNVAPLEIWESDNGSASSEALRLGCYLYAQPHLPQGAPSSPALANLCAYRLDCRLSGLARSAGATYTRYADDLAFSGDENFSRIVNRFQLHVCATAMEEGFSVRHRKTRIMRRAMRQRLAGVIVNERLNIDRAEYDRLKAMLHNCLSKGTHTQNRSGHGDFRAHLLGKISFVKMIHPRRGQRLEELFAKIAW